MVPLCHCQYSYSGLCYCLKLIMVNNAIFIVYVIVIILPNKNMANICDDCRKSVLNKM